MVVIPKYHSGHPAHFSHRVSKENTKTLRSLSFPEICFTWCVMLGVFEVGQAMTIFSHPAGHPLYQKPTKKEKNTVHSCLEKFSRTLQLLPPMSKDEEVSFLKWVRPGAVFVAILLFGKQGLSLGSLANRICWSTKRRNQALDR